MPQIVKRRQGWDVQLTRCTRLPAGHDATAFQGQAECIIPPPIPIQRINPIRPGQPTLTSPLPTPSNAQEVGYLGFGEDVIATNEGQLLSDGK
jgi:hypothetical protein